MFFLELFFIKNLLKNLLPVDSCPQNSITEAILLYIHYFEMIGLSRKAIQYTGEYIYFPVVQNQSLIRVLHFAKVHDFQKIRSLNLQEIAVKQLSLKLYKVYIPNSLLISIKSTQNAKCKLQIQNQFRIPSIVRYISESTASQNGCLQIFVVLYTFSLIYCYFQLLIAAQCVPSNTAKQKSSCKQTRKRQ